MAARSSKKQQTASGPVEIWKLIGWSLLAAGWTMLAVALATYSPLDPLSPGQPGQSVGLTHEQPGNWIGQVGADVAHRLYLMLGPGVWVGMAGVGAYLLLAAAGRRMGQLAIRAVGLLLMAVATSAILAVALPGLIDSLQRGPAGPGGLLALFITDQLMDRFAWPGTLLILAAAFWVGAVLAVDELVLLLPRLVGRGVGRLMSIRLPGSGNAAGGRSKASGGSAWAMVTGLLTGRPAGETASSSQQRARSGRGAAKRRAEEQAGWIDEDAGGLGGTESFDPDEYEHHPDDDDEEAEDWEEADETGEGEWEYEDEAEADGEDEDEEAEAAQTYMAQREAFDPDQLREKMQKLPINFAPRTQSRKAAPREPDFSGYQLPGLDLLIEPDEDYSSEMEQVVRDQAVQLESALREYKIEGEVVGIDSGPVITMFEVRLAPGTKAAQINNVSTDLARALKAQNIRVVPNMAGKDTIGIEVPNHKKERVRLRELMAAQPDAAESMKLPMFLGKDASGNPLIEDLAKMPHMLIAGTTGSGKSVCESSIIMSLLYTRRPDEVKFVLVDPKIVEMSQYKDVPHLMCPPVTEMSKAVSILEWAVTKMDERYELLAEAGVRDIASYNQLGWEELKERFEPATEEEAARIPKKLPYMVFVIDELADLIMTNKEVESHIVRIAQKARAVGIHLILATQRPQANVVTGLIKANLPCRVSLKVASGMDSRIVLDQKGGELLLGHGDMLFLSSSSHKLTRAQGTLVDDQEIRRTVKFLKGVAHQHFEPQLVQIRSADEKSVDEEAARDPLFEDAVKVVLEAKRGSVSLLQRRLTIGYGRAARLIEAMAAAGILGEYKGSQAREVTLTVEEWEAMRAQAEADARQHQADEVDEVDEVDEADDDGQSAAADLEDEEQDQEEDDEEYEYEYVDEDEPEDDEEYEYEYEEDEEEAEEEEEEDDEKQRG